MDMENTVAARSQRRPALFEHKTDPVKIGAQSTQEAERSACRSALPPRVTNVSSTAGPVRHPGSQKNRSPVQNPRHIHFQLGANSGKADPRVRAGVDPRQIWQQRAAHRPVGPFRSPKTPMSHKKGRARGLSLTLASHFLLDRAVKNIEPRNELAQLLHQRLAFHGGSASTSSVSQRPPLTPRPIAGELLRIRRGLQVDSEALTRKKSRPFSTPWRSW